MEWTEKDDDDIRKFDEHQIIVSRLEAKIEDLEKALQEKEIEIARLKKDGQTQWQFKNEAYEANLNLMTEIKSLEEKCKRLKLALHKYGIHDFNCTWNADNTCCDCGFKKFLAAQEEKC